MFLGHINHELEVTGCSKLVRLGEKDEEDCRSNMLTSLRILKLRDCNNLKDCSRPSGIEKLEINDCTTTRVSLGGGMEKLRSLTVTYCNELVMGKELLGGGENIHNTHMLEEVRICGLPSMKSINGLLNSIHPTTLTSLRISDCKNMESFPYLRNLTSLTRLVIIGGPSMDACSPLEHWPPKLTTLVIGGFKKPISEWGPQNFPSSLVILWLDGSSDDEVRDLSALSHHLFPSSLTALRLWNFLHLKRVSEGLKHLISLKHLNISYSPKLKELPDMLLPSLLSLKIKGCPKRKEKASKRALFNSYWPKISHIPRILIDDELQN